LAEISLNISGPYENVATFFAETEKELRLMDTVNLSMKKTKTLDVVKNKQVVSEQLEVGAVIQSYYQNTK